MKRKLEICEQCSSFWTHSSKLHICNQCRVIDYYYSAVIERLPWRNGWDWDEARKAFESVDVPEKCRLMEKYGGAE